MKFEPKEHIKLKSWCKLVGSEREIGNKRGQAQVISFSDNFYTVNKAYFGILDSNQVTNLDVASLAGILVVQENNPKI